MRLKCLELSGFKSFVDPTKIELGNGINAIVGPNGCGKSNIVDAIRWVLGEHSARHLRGAMMEDMIFQGSETRAPVSICDVELTFAVQRGKLPSPYHEMDEIRVRRRLIRNAGSDAFINGKMVRLKDIIDLFLDTGVSTRAYAIVEQGSIARMITAKPEERRQLLEEAAGVMKYRSRRKEAERKMNSTRQNMERIEDLLEEVRTQCRTLKQQAARAERFKNMQAEFEQAQAKALAIRFQKQKAHLLAFQEQFEQAQAGEQGIQQQHIRLERQLNQSRRATVLHDEEVQQAQDILRQSEQQRANLQQQAERQAGERRLLLERQGMLQQRLDETAFRQQQLTSDCNDIQTQLDEQTDSNLQEHRRDAEMQLEHAQEMLQQAQEDRDLLLRELEQLRSLFHDLQQRQQQAEKNTQHLSHKQAQYSEQLQQLFDKNKAIEQEVSTVEKQYTQTQQDQKEAEVAIHDAQLYLDECRESQQKSLLQRKQAEQVLRTLSGEVQELNAQLKQNNMSDTLRQRMREKGGLWVDEKLDVPEGLELAVAAALRGQEGDLSLSTQIGAQDWEAICLEVRDSPIAMHRNPMRVNDIHSNPVQQTGGKVPDAQKTLASLLNLESTHPLYGIFCHALFCENVCEGAFSEHIPKYDCLISRDGWRLESDGWIIPPTKSQTARRLILQRRLQHSEIKQSSAQEAMQKAEQSVENIEHTLIQLQQQWQTMHLNVTQTRSDSQASKALLQRLRDEHNSITSRHESLQQDTQRVEQELQHWQQQLEGIGAVDQQKLIQAQENLDQQTLMQQQCEQQWQQARSFQAHADQALALHKQTVGSLKRDKKRLQQELEQLQQRHDHDQQQLLQTQTKIDDHHDHAILDMQLETAHTSVEKAHAALTDMRQQGHSLQKQLHAYEHDEKEMRKNLQQAAERKQQIEISLASEQTRLLDLNDEIEQRCQITSQQLLQKHEHIADEDMDIVLADAHALEARLSRFGPVNLLAIDEFQQASEREQFLAEQVADLEASLDTLGETIKRIDRTTRQRFRDTFDQTNAYFKEIFPRLFGGGKAELKLDSDDVLSAGVEVVAQPPGKCLQDLTLLSGGEKALTAVALVFAIFRINPAPFCILDEVDAPLDDSNVGRFADMIAEFCQDVQFLAISHNKITMQKADQLIGVSMPESGVSRIVSVDMASIPE